MIPIFIMLIHGHHVNMIMVWASADTGATLTECKNAKFSIYIVNEQVDASKT